MLQTQQNGACHVCPLCASEAELAFVHRVLGCIEAEYWICRRCSFVYARPATWLDRAYTSAIASTDTGAVVRGEWIARTLTAFAWLCGLRASRGLDVGGGHGLLVRMLRDRGLDFRWSDKYAENLFAKGFEDDDSEYAWLTLVELFEHLVEPYDFLRRLIERYKPRCVFLTTELRPTRVPPKDWWYWSFETGQHIGFAARSSLEVLAERLGYRLATHASTHLLYTKERDRLAFRAACSRISQPLAMVASHILRPLTIDDHLKMVDLLRADAEPGKR